LIFPSIATTEADEMGLDQQMQELIKRERQRERGGGGIYTQGERGEERERL